jgi:hypothetical protein
MSAPAKAEGNIHPASTKHANDQSGKTPDYFGFVFTKLSGCGKIKSVFIVVNHSPPQGFTLWH